MLLYLLLFCTLLCWKYEEYLNDNNTNNYIQFTSKTYQAASGAGQPGMDELIDGTKSVLSGERDVAENKIFAHPLPFNVIPHIDKFQENGYTKEEMKVTWETRKICGLDDDFPVRLVLLLLLGVDIYMLDESLYLILPIRSLMPHQLHIAALQFVSPHHVPIQNLLLHYLTSRWMLLPLVRHLRRHLEFCSRMILRIW